MWRSRARKLLTRPFWLQNRGWGSDFAGERIGARNRVDHLLPVDLTHRLISRFAPKAFFNRASSQAAKIGSRESENIDQNRAKNKGKKSLPHRGGNVN